MATEINKKIPKNFGIFLIVFATMRRFFI